MKRAATLSFGSLSSYNYGVDTYDPNKLGLGQLMVQRNGGGDETFAGPIPLRVARPMEASTAIPGAFPWALQWQNNAAGQLDWLFLADNATAAATRRLVLYTFNRRTATWTWGGFITITFPVATNITIRGMRMVYRPYSTGTVAVSGTGVTGTSTVWNSNCCVGNRIGFGSTDPTQITTWYDITARASDTSITINVSAGTIGAGTPYVIEDLRAVLSTTNATATNGGLFVCKGLSYSQFSSVGGTVPAATTVDNIRACYWLADASTVTNTVSTGLALSSETGLAEHFCYVVDGTTAATVFKYNLRAALTLTAGKTTNAFVFKTGGSGTLTGTMGQNNNSRLATVAHGPHSGVECLYWTTTTRIYAVPTSAITNGSTTFLSAGSVGVEIPAGGASTFAATGGLSALEYSGVIDRFVVATNATSKNYVTQYRNDSGQFDRNFGADFRQTDQSIADGTITPVLSQTGGAYSVWVEGGLAYFAVIGATAIINRLYATPFGADWEYCSLTDGFILSPSISLPDCSSVERVAVNMREVIGGRTAANLGLPTEPFRTKFRTSGITDNSGGWTDVSDEGTLSGAATEIQFRFEFRTIGLTCIPARLLNLIVSYEDNGTDSRFQFSATKSDATNKRFAYRHATAFGGTVPALRIRLFNAVTGATLLDDTTTASASGTWQKATDGSTFGAYNSTDKANETTYIRYTPTTLADNINVRSVLTLA